MLKPQNPGVTSDPLPSFVSHISHQQSASSPSNLYLSPSISLHHPCYHHPFLFPSCHSCLSRTHSPQSSQNGPSPAHHSPHFQWSPLHMQNKPQVPFHGLRDPHHLASASLCVLCPECSSLGSHMIVHSYLSSFPCFLPISYDNLLLLCLFIVVCLPTRM